MSENWEVGNMEKLHCEVEDYVTKAIFCLLLRQGQKQDKKLEVQLFLVYLLV